MTTADSSSISRTCSRTEQVLQAAKKKIDSLKVEQAKLHSQIDWENPDLELLRKLNLVNYSLEVAEMRCVRTIPQTQLNLHLEHTIKGIYE